MTIEVPPGLDGVVVTTTEVGEVEPDADRYRYRGHDAIEVARTRTFEDAWALLVDGRLPEGGDRAAFAAEVAAARHVPTALVGLLPALAGLEPLDALRTALSALAGLHPGGGLDLHPAEVRARLLAATAVLPTMAVTLHQIRAGREPRAPRDDLSHAGNLLWLLHGTEPDPEHERALDAYLVVAADHGLNPGTFAARVVASTGTAPVAALVGALAAFGGRLHGATPVVALDMLDEIGTPEAAAAWVGERLAASGRIMGFGHRLYRGEDPRAVFLRSVAEPLDDPAVATARAVEEAVARLLPELRPGRSLKVNLELYAGPLLRSVGVPRDLMVGVFAASRSVGWSAHVAEQLAANRIYRPVARYVGPPLAPVPPPSAGLIPDSAPHRPEETVMAEAAIEILDATDAAAVAEAVEALARILPQLSSSSPAPTAEEVAEIAASPATVLFLARLDGRLVGSLTLALFRIPTGLRAWIEDVVVDDAARGAGVGAALNRAALEEARRRGAKTVDLTSRPSREAANRLYQRLGFQARETNVYRFDL